MGKLSWYKRYPKAALVGMSMLTPEERGIYNTVLDLIYDSDNQLRDDERFISGWCNCDVRVWRRVKMRLVQLEKLGTETIAGEVFVRNARASRGVDEALGRHLSAQDAAFIKHGMSMAELREIKRLRSAAGGAGAKKPHPIQNIDYSSSHRVRLKAARATEEAARSIGSIIADLAKSSGTKS